MAEKIVRPILTYADECHRAVTPGTKREQKGFFGRSLWYGFTGTPRFAENPYPQKGDLPRTTEDLYGERLHKYTIQSAIHDKAVLGFQVEHNGPKDIDDETDGDAYSWLMPPFPLRLSLRNPASYIQSQSGLPERYRPY